MLRECKIFVMIHSLITNIVTLRKGMMRLYLTIKETAEFLSMPEASIKTLVQNKKIRALYDGEQYLINKDQFTTHLKQVEKYKELIEEILNEPIPEDMDIKDED